MTAGTGPLLCNVMSSPSRLRAPAGVPRRPVASRAAEYVTAGWKRVPDWLAVVRSRYLFHTSVRKLRGQPQPLRLCLGSGPAPLPSWTNVDLYFPADVRLDLRAGLPLPDASVELIYSEHLFEHFPLDTAMALFRECCRVLLPTGVMRVAMPDLEDVVRDYPKRWRDAAWVNWPEYGWIDTGVRMVNTAVRDWGHLYLYDFAELELRLMAAGFTKVERCQLGESTSRELQGLETRADSLLIVEAHPAEGAAG